MLQGNYQFPVNATFIGTCTGGCNPLMVPRQAEISITWSASEHGSARKASRFEDFGIPDTRRRTLCNWQGCSHVLLSFEDQAAHEALHHDHRFSTDSTLLASENDGRLRL